MKIHFPIDNDTDYEVFMAIMDPDLLAIEYASIEAQNLYNSLSTIEKKEIKIYVNRIKFLQEWCNNHAFPWTIRDSNFYWQTHIQTAEFTFPNHITWHEHDYFDKVINKKW